MDQILKIVRNGLMAGAAVGVAGLLLGLMLRIMLEVVAGDDAAILRRLIVVVVSVFLGLAIDHHLKRKKGGK